MSFQKGHAFQKRQDQPCLYSIATALGGEAMPPSTCGAAETKMNSFAPSSYLAVVKLTPALFGRIVTMVGSISRGRDPGLFKIGFFKIQFR